MRRATTSYGVEITSLTCESNYTQWNDKSTDHAFFLRQQTVKMCFNRMDNRNASYSPEKEPRWESVVTKQTIPKGSLSPTLLTASAMEEASLLITSCFGTSTVPAYGIIHSALAI